MLCNIEEMDVLYYCLLPVQVNYYIFGIFLLACSEEFSGGILWSSSRQDLLVTEPCSVLHSSFRSGVAIGRHCQNDSTWSRVDLTNCTMFVKSSPVILIYFSVEIDPVDANKIIKNVSSFVVNCRCTHRKFAP